MTNRLLAQLKTETPTFRFSIDDTEYELRSWSSLDRLEEGRMSAMLRKQRRLAAELDKINPDTNEPRFMEVAMASRKSRLDIIGLMTNVPPELVERLPLDAQYELIRLVNLTPAELRKELEEDEAAEEDEE